MIDAALAVALKGQSSLLQEWTGIKGVKGKPGKQGLFHRVTSASRRRNNLAHYTVVHLGMVKKPPSIYMRESLTKPSAQIFSSTRPTGGYYVTDLRSIRQEFIDLSNAIRDFTDRIKKPIEHYVKSSRREQDRQLKNALKSLKSAKRAVMKNRSQRG
jgi:hypothetical protein